MILQINGRPVTCFQDVDDAIAAAGAAAAGGGSSLQQDGAHEALSAGTRQLLFRFSLSSGEPAVVAVRLGCSSPALAAAAALVAVDNGSGERVSAPLNRIEGLQVRWLGVCASVDP